MLNSWYRLISAGYSDVMGMRIVKGRAIAEREAAPAVVVNETRENVFRGRRSAPPIASASDATGGVR
jgi:hypothetical protein